MKYEAGKSYMTEKGIVVGPICSTRDTLSCGCQITHDADMGYWNSDGVPCPNTNFTKKKYGALTTEVTQ